MSSEYLMENNILKWYNPLLVLQLVSQIIIVNNALLKSYESIIRL